MAIEYQFPYSKMTREDGEVIPATDHNKQEDQVECLTDAVGNYNFSKGDVEGRLDILEGGPITPHQEVIPLDPAELPITTTGGDVTLVNKLTFTPEPESVKLFLNRLYHTQGAGFDYVLGGVDNKSIVWQVGTGTAPDLGPGDTLVAYYWS